MPKTRLARLIPHSRFWEIDALRGTAVITMVAYHLMWDLRYFGVFPDVDLWSGFWMVVQRFTAVTFIALVGVSLTLVYRRSRAAQGTQSGLYWQYFRRGLKIFGLGMLITLVVRAAGIGYVDFGILHLIGFSIMIAYPFLRFTWLNLGIALVFFAAGGLVAQWRFDGFWFTPQIGSWIGIPTWIGGWLIPFGVAPTRYLAVDYFPILPWFGVVLVGIWFGNWFYAGSRWMFTLPDWGDRLPVKWLDTLGRNSLVLYLIHQPLLLAGLASLGMIKW